ncbi:hypothetical protein [Streptomyces atratus]|uniref:hypothetical protein n=1 Tax=Streptomyces atratus TaxID=1893 RepID=UPI003658919D
MTGLGTALTALIHGSMILTGKACGCAVHGVRLAWDAASTDPEATAQRQTKADRAAQQKELKARREKRDDQDDDQDDDGAAGDLSEVTAPPVAPVRRPALESLGVLALGTALAAGAVSAAWRMAAPAAGAWWADMEPYRYLIITGAGLAWMVAAWMIAPPPAAKDDDQGEWDDDQDDAAGAPEDRGTALLWHVIRDLSDAEYSKRAGVHLDVLLDSATAAGHVPEDTDLTVMRAWLEAAGLPVVDKLGMRIEGKPVTRVGVRIDAATAALGMTPTALLEARAGTPAGGGPAAPGGPVGETPASTPAQSPAEVPAEVPVPAVLALIPGGRQPLSEAPSPALSQEKAQEAR